MAQKDCSEPMSIGIDIGKDISRIVGFGPFGQRVLRKQIKQLYNGGRSIHRKLRKPRQGETSDQELEAEVLAFFDGTRREPKTGPKNLAALA